MGGMVQWGGRQTRKMSVLTPSNAPVVSLSQKLDSHFLVLVKVPERDLSVISQNKINRL